jgi:hypothetical protein
VAGPDLLILLVIVPLLASCLSILALRSTLRTRARGLPPDVRRLLSARFAVLSGYGLTPVLLGFVLWLMLQPETGQLAASTSTERVALLGLVLWFAGAYAVAASATTVARTTVLRTRAGLLMGRDYGRVLVFAELPLSAVVFAGVAGFLIVSGVGGFLAGSSSSVVGNVGAVVSALQAFSIGILAYPVAAFASGRVHDLSPRGFTRILLVLAAGEVPAVFGLLLVIQALYPITG